MATPSGSEGGSTAGGGRTREQLVKLLETSAKKLKQYDRKYAEAKKQNERAQACIREKVEECASLREELRHAADRQAPGSAVEGEGPSPSAEREELERNLAERERLVVDLEERLSVEASSLARLGQSHEELGRKLEDREAELERAKECESSLAEEVSRLSGVADTLKERLDEAQRHEQHSPSPNGEDLRPLVHSLREENVAQRDEIALLREQCEKLSDNDDLSNKELSKRLETTQQKDRALLDAESKIATLQAARDFAETRAAEVEAALADLVAERDNADGVGSEPVSPAGNGSIPHMGETVSEPGSPSSPALSDTAASPGLPSPALAEREADLAQQNQKLRATLEDTKRKFLVAAKKKQAEYNAKLKALKEKVTSLQTELDGRGRGGSLPEPPSVGDGEAEALLRAQLQEAEGQLAQAREELGASKATVQAVSEKLERCSLDLESCKSAGEEVRILRAERDELESKLREAERSRQDLAQTQQAKSEKESTNIDRLKQAVVELRKKAERAEKGRSKADQQLQEARGELAGEREKLERLRGQHADDQEATQADLESVRAELSSYKSRAHRLLQQREQQLRNTVSSEEAAMLKDRIASLEAEVEESFSSRRDAEEALARLGHQAAADKASLVEGFAREMSDKDAETSRRALQAREELSQAQEQASGAREALEDERKAHGDLAETCARLDGELAAASKETEGLRESHKFLEREFNAYKQMTEDTMLVKDAEIARLKSIPSVLTITEKATEPKEAAAAPPLPPPRASSNGEEAPRAKRPSFSLGEDLLGDVGGTDVVKQAREQAARDEIARQYLGRISELEVELEEVRREIEMREELESVLKEELRTKDREHVRNNIKESQTDMEYLKNIVLKLIETGEHEALLPVIQMLLQLSSDEVRRIREVYAQGRGPGQQATNQNLNEAIEYASQTATQAATDGLSYLSSWVFSPPNTGQGEPGT